MLRIVTTICAVVASATLLPAGIAVAAEQPRPSAPMASASQEAAAKARLSLREIAVRVEAEGYRDIEEIEREGEEYEVCAKDKQGREVELTVNAKTGKIEKVELNDD